MNTPAGVVKIFCWNGSGSDIKNVPEMEAGLMKLMLLTWKMEWWKYFAEMEVGVTKRLFPEMEVGLMKLMLLSWKLEWWKYVVELEAGLMKRMFYEMEAGLTKRNVAELEAGNYMKLIFYFATNCPRRIVLRRIVRDELSCNELSGNPAR